MTIFAIALNHTILFFFFGEEGFVIWQQCSNSRSWAISFYLRKRQKSEGWKMWISKNVIISSTVIKWDSNLVDYQSSKVATKVAILFMA